MNSVCTLDSKLVVWEFGGKAANLSTMIRAGLPVPKGFAIGLTAFEHNGKLSKDASNQVPKLLDKNKLYAVRSSALAEDAEGASWAGQFETFLNVSPGDVLGKIQECHNSAKARAHAYANQQTGEAKFDIAVVVQEMINPELAGVLFTKDPVSGENKLVTEYVEGLGEDLVSGRADPKQISWKPGEKVKAPFDINELTNLAGKVEKVFGNPQDIEWAYADKKMWLVQARPITVVQTSGNGFNLGEPEDLFYWGPSRALPKYMSDFTAAAEQFFIEMTSDPDLPNPPKTLVLFWDKKVVWLINAQAFADFAEATFVAYAKQNRFDKDYSAWLASIKKLKDADAPELVEAWTHTLFGEFSLYGAEIAIAKRLDRLNPKERQQVWGAFTYPDKTTFMNAIDQELYASQDIAAIAKKYSWIDDGYRGVANTAHEYFTKRLKILQENPPHEAKPNIDREHLIKEFDLSDEEVHNLDLARKLAEFIDERKAWMMRTRRNIHKSAIDIEYGWFFAEGKSTSMTKKDVKELWNRYLDFKTSTSAVAGVVASNGGHHFVHGEVRVVTSPTENIEDDKILVVPATSPSYVPLMRKARALITDHGGMMSHAAIVGREFNLPCIVGTKNGTKVLKDGDKVVLDLVRGEVNK